MQPFVWPCGRLWEEGRRQVDIWLLCYCEFQILWLSPTLNLVEFFNLGIPESSSLAVTDVALRSPFSDPLPPQHCVLTCTYTHKLQDSLFRQKKVMGKKQYLTDSRARVRFRFNVRLHADGGLWDLVAGEKLGLVWKGVGLVGVPCGSRPFCTYKNADVTRRYLQMGWRKAAFYCHFNLSSHCWWRTENTVSCKRRW